MVLNNNKKQSKLKTKKKHSLKDCIRSAGKGSSGGKYKALTCEEHMRLEFNY